jgi:hypothetical protein
MGGGCIDRYFFMRKAKQIVDIIWSNGELPELWLSGVSGFTRIFTIVWTSITSHLDPWHKKKSIIANPLVPGS